MRFTTLHKKKAGKKGKKCNNLEAYFGEKEKKNIISWKRSMSKEKEIVWRKEGEGSEKRHNVRKNTM